MTVQSGSAFPFSWRAPAGNASAFRDDGHGELDLIVAEFVADSGREPGTVDHAIQCFQRSNELRRRLHRSGFEIPERSHARVLHQEQYGLKGDWRSTSQKPGKAITVGVQQCVRGRGKDRIATPLKLEFHVQHWPPWLGIATMRSPGLNPYSVEAWAWPVVNPYVVIAVLRSGVITVKAG